VAEVGRFTGESAAVPRVVHVLATPGDLVLLTSFGSGAGSDSFVIRVKDRISEVQDLAPKTRSQLDENKIYLEYGAYAKLRGKIRMAE